MGEVFDKNVVAQKAGVSLSSYYKWIKGSAGTKTKAAIESAIDELKNESKMVITDVDKQINRNGYFGIEVDDHWVKVDSVDFFSYLYNTGRIDGHDPDEMKVVQETKGYYCDRRKNYIDGAFRTVSYQDLLSDITDEEFHSYIQTLVFSKPEPKAAAA